VRLGRKTLKFRRGSTNTDRLSRSRFTRPGRRGTGGEKLEPLLDSEAAVVQAAAEKAEPLNPRPSLAPAPHQLELLSARETYRMAVFFSQQAHCSGNH
jgi:hypothetical protein